MEILLRFIVLVVLYVSFHCFALLLGGWLIRFADYESPAPAWRRAILAGLVSAVGVMILDALVRTNLNTFEEIRRAERILRLGSALILLVCHRIANREGDRADFVASAAIILMFWGVTAMIIPLNDWLHPWIEQKRDALEEKMEIENRNKNDSTHEKGEDP